MIRDVDGGVVVECDVCGRGMDDDGHASTRAATFCDRGDAGVFIGDCQWDRVGDYAVCPECVERIVKGEVDVRFMLNVV